MRKSKDGYVLIYVVFVIIFLCIVAVGTCTVALNNIRVQTAYIAQLQDRYAAEGTLEQFMGEVCIAANGLANAGYTSGAEAKAALDAQPDMLDPRKMLAPARDAAVEIIREKIRVFGSSGKAVK